MHPANERRCYKVGGGAHLESALNMDSKSDSNDWLRSAYSGNESVPPES